MSFESEPEPVAKKQFNEDIYISDIQKLQQLLEEANKEWLKCYQSNISDEEAWKKILALSDKLDKANNSNDIIHQSFVNSLKSLEKYLEEYYYE